MTGTLNMITAAGIIWNSDTSLARDGASGALFIGANGVGSTVSLRLGGAGASKGSLIFGQTTAYQTTITGAATANWTLTLPPTAGTNTYVLQTDGSGNTSWVAQSGGTPLSVAGDLLYENSTPAPARLGIGSTGQVLTVVGGLPAWANSASGFSNPMTAHGDIIYENASLGPTNLSIGASGYVLTVVAGQPAWAASSSASLAGDSDVQLSSPSDGDVLTYVTADSKWENKPATGGGGAVVKLAETILSSDTATVTFSSISGSYRNLKLFITARESGSAETFYIQFNGDTGANYGSVNQYGGTSTGAGTYFSSATPTMGYATATGDTANFASVNEITIYDYARTVWCKTMTNLSGNMRGGIASNMYVVHLAGSWNNSAAISSVLIGLTDGANFKSGSVFSLYGVS
jgi:hypothetical protein